jgi:hypothetical protein
MAYMPIIYALIALLVVFVIARVARTYFHLGSNFQVLMDIVLALIVVGVLLWLINTYVPMAGAIKGLLNVVVFVAACIWVLKAFGLWDPAMRWFSDFRSHRVIH